MEKGDTFDAENKSAHIQTVALSVRKNPPGFFSPSLEESGHSPLGRTTLLGIKLKTMRFRFDLKDQLPVLLLAVGSTMTCLFLALRLLPDGIDWSFSSYSNGAAETLRGQPNPGGSGAIAVVFLPFVPVICWWSILSDWKEARRQAEKEKAEAGAIAKEEAKAEAAAKGKK